MSLHDKKSLLFSKSSTSSDTSTTVPKPKPLTSSINNVSYGASGSGSLLSPAQKQKKLDEAKENLAKGNQYLQTSMFQWAPDYLGN